MEATPEATLGTQTGDRAPEVQWGVRPPRLAGRR